jgi:hypothetical protein
MPEYYYVNLLLEMFWLAYVLDSLGSIVTKLSDR